MKENEVIIQLKVIKNLGNASERLFGKPGTIHTLVNGTLIDFEQNTWKGLSTGFTNADVAITYFYHLNTSATLFEECKEKEIMPAAKSSSTETLDVIQAGNMPYGTKFYMTLATGETYNVVLKHFKVSNDACIVYEGTEEPITLNPKYTNAKFVVIEQQVTLWEAIQSDKSCKIKHTLLKDNDKFKEFSSIQCILKELSTYDNMQDILKTAEWFLR